MDNPTDQAYGGQMEFTYDDGSTRTTETVGDLFSALNGLTSEPEGQRFMREYMADLKSRNVPEPERTAWSNVGYVARYGDDETNDRIRSYTGAQHPIFG